MATERISAQMAHEHVQSKPDALLVCAYDDQEKCRKNQLEGAMSLDAFRAQLKSIPRDREIIFYCT